MCDFGTPVGSYLSNMFDMKSKGPDPYNGQQQNISFGHLTLKQPLIMLISKNKFLQPMLYEPKSGGTSPGFHLGASVPYGLAVSRDGRLLALHVRVFENLLGTLMAIRLRRAVSRVEERFPTEQASPRIWG